MDPDIDEALVRRLVAAQFPEWEALSLRQLLPGGWDNKSFRLGDSMLVRLPSAVEYASQPEKEARWLPRLAPHLPLAIPKPLAFGAPGEGYPWNWSVYRWLEGKAAAEAGIDDLRAFSFSLAEFLRALQQIDTTDGPTPGAPNFYRGAPLAVYDKEVRLALKVLPDTVDAAACAAVWEAALASVWEGAPVWVHGDISAGNLLMQEGRLSAVIDFGQLAVGDPACDLAIAWTLCDAESREIFRAALPFDAGTWARGRGWALWKALIVAAGLTHPGNAEAKRCLRTIESVLSDFRRTGG